MTDFTGFPKATFTYLADLEGNNSREWFQDNRSDYDAYVLAPSLAFISALADPMSTLDPACTADPRLNGSFRRLNRDVRFSKDKSPYAPRIHMVFWAGDHPMRSPAIHLVLHKDGYGFGAGQWQWTPDVLERYRSCVQDTDARAELEAALTTAASVGCERDEPPLKRPAGGVDAADPAAHHLRYKNLVVRTLTNQPLPNVIHENGFVSTVVELAKTLSPINKWLKYRLNP